MAKVEFGGIVASEGKKAHGYFSVARTASQMPINVPVWIANGRTEGPTFCVIAGDHGIEYSGMEAVRRLMQQVDPETLRGRIVTIPCVNTPGFGKSRACPLDQKNINRMFPGNANGSISEIIAYLVFRDFIAKSNFFADLHDGAGGLYPFACYHRTGRKEVDNASEALVRSCGMQEVAITEAGYDKGQSYAEASERGIPSVLWEAPGAAGTDEQSVGIHFRALQNCLKHLHMIDGSIEAPSEIEFLQGFQTVNVTEGGFFYAKATLGKSVEKNQIIGEIVDFFGEKKEDIRSPAKGIVLSLKVNTNHAVDAGESVAEIGLRELVREQRPPL
jgi:predicted deacylase